MDIAEFVLQTLGSVIRLIGFLLFGLTVVWFVLKQVSGEKPWQLVAVVASVFLVFAGLILWRATPGAAGMFTLGAAIGFFLYGMRTPKPKEEEQE